MHLLLAARVCLCRPELALDLKEEVRSDVVVRHARHALHHSATHCTAEERSDVTSECTLRPLILN